MVKSLKARVSAEEQVLTGPHKTKALQEVQDFLDSQAIRDAQISQADGSRVNNKAFFDIKDLLSLSQYSGAKEEMEKILNNDAFLQNLHKENDKMERPSWIDRDLLDDKL